MELRVDAVMKWFSGRKVVDAVSLRFDQPGVVVLLGENGAGKSTLLRMIAGVLVPDGGAVLVDGEPIWRPTARRKLGYVPEGADPLPELTVAELLALYAALKRVPLPDGQLAERLGAQALFGQRIGSLSLGQRRRACLLAALVGDPGCLVLDEPTNGLDPDGVAMLAGLLRERAAAGKMALVATHDLGFASAVAVRRVRMAGGLVVDDGTAEHAPSAR